jgi:hypothetical protein
VSHERFTANRALRLKENTKNPKRRILTSGVFHRFSAPFRGLDNIVIPAKAGIQR